MAAEKAPAGLGAAGRALWKRMVADYEYEPREVLLLEAAARQADDVAALEAAVADEGLSVRGSQGQPRLNPAVTELRQSRLALARLLGDLAIPAADEKPLTAAGLRAQKAAVSRWDRQRARRGA